MRKLKASTLIESITALTLIAIAFSASIVSFISVTSSGSMSKKITVHQWVKSIAINTKKTNNYIDKTIDKGDIHILKTVNKQNDTGLLLLNIKAVGPNGRVIENYREFILVKENEKN